jgi:guanosine-3',5'-bis(diphosphate) 3'-pyrophosphohydrolase
MAKALDNNFELFSPETLVDIFLSLHSNYSGYPDTVVTAFEIAREAHGSQYRKSGEPYFFHPLSVAEIVASLGADEVTISAALLHDAVEDTELTLAEVEERFGSVVAQIVDGVTKLDRLSFESKEAQQA